MSFTNSAPNSTISQTRLLPSAIDRTPPSANRKRALQTLTVNTHATQQQPPRPRSAQEFTTPEHPTQYKKMRKVSDSTNSARRCQSSNKENSSGDSTSNTPEDSVWGPDVEAAFMDAIKKIPKLGRRKICVGSKPCGRNELIADFIMRRTGKRRTRKQVSSHIQVLKHIKRDDPEFLALVAENSRDSELGDDVPHISDSSPSDLAYHTTTPFSATSATYFQSPADTSPLMLVSRSRSQGQELVIPNQEFYGTQAQRHSPFESAPLLSFGAFYAWITRRNHETSEDEIVHYYAKHMHLRSGSMELDSLPHWDIKFPCLGKIIGESVTAVEYPIYHVQASLALPALLDLDSKFHSTVLRTELAMLLHTARPKSNMSCRTRIYSAEGQIADLKSHNVIVEPPAQFNSNDDGHSRPKSGIRVAVPFATEFWAAILTDISHNIQSAGFSGRPNAEEERASVEHQALEKLQTIKMVQEIFTHHPSGSGSVSRAAVLIWEFRGTERGTEGSVHVSSISTPAVYMKDSSITEPLMQSGAHPNSRVKGTQMARSVSAYTQPSDRSFVMPKKPSSHALQRSQSVASFSNKPQSSITPQPVRNLSAYYQSLALNQPVPETHLNSLQQQPYFDMTQIHSAVPQPYLSQFSNTQISSASPSMMPHMFNVPMARSFSAPSGFMPNMNLVTHVHPSQQQYFTNDGLNWQTQLSAHQNDGTSSDFSSFPTIPRTEETFSTSGFGSPENEYLAYSTSSALTSSSTNPPFSLSTGPPQRPHTTLPLTSARPEILEGEAPPMGFFTIQS